MIERELSPLVAGLNDEQQRAVVTVDGPVLVVAGPGSGKTRVLTHRIAFLIQERNVLPDQILAVTFTNKAAREMRDRIERLVGKQAAAGLVMGTFHSFGVRLLRQNPGIVADRLGLLPNFLIYDDADQMEIMKRSIVDVGLDPKQVAPRRVLSRVSAAKAMLVTADEFASQTANYGDEVVARAYAAYQRLLRKANAVDFDDLLALPIRLFDEAPALLERYQSRFRYIMVDEYQDTNRVQYVLVTALAAIHRNLFVVGDPDQSIYGWRQADIRNILDFEKDYPDATRIHLELNYRSSRRIVDAADRVIRINTQRIDRRLRTENDDGEEVVLRELSDGAHEASFIVGEIRRLMKSSDIGGESFAVMYRTTAQSRVIEEAFRVSDIPYRIVGGVRFYDRREVKDVLAVLRLLHNPADEVSLQRALDNLPIGRGLGPKALDTLRLWANQHGEPFLNALVAFAPEKTATTTSPPSLSGSAKSAAQRFGSAVASLRSVAGTVPLTELLDALLDATKYQDSFDQENEEELQRWANVLELRSDLAKYDLLEPADALATYLEQVALVSDVDTMEDDSRRRVTLITLHSAKGLEFPIVFIAGVEDGLLPINRAIEAEWNDPMPMEEERRLFYVGITRAQNLLYITFAPRRLAYGSFQPGLPSRFLAALPEIGVRSAVRSSTRSGRLSEQVRERTGATDDTGMVSRSSHTAGSPAAAPTAFQRVRPGQRVFHVKFGEGVVLNVVDKPEDQEVTVDFKREGRKIFMASFAHFDLID